MLDAIWCESLLVTEESEMIKMYVSENKVSETNISEETINIQQKQKCIKQSRFLGYASRY